MATKVVNGLDLQSQKIINLADGTAPGDAVTKAQLDAVLRGLDWKNSVRAATTTNITLTGTQTVDGVALIAGDRVLVKDQTTATANGIYVVAAGAWARATDFDDNIEVTAAAAIPVEAGTVNGDAVFILTNDGSITIGSTSLTFTRLGGSGATYTAGANGGLILSGSAFSIQLDTNSGLALGAGGVKIDPTQFATLGIVRKYSADVAAGSTTATVTHNLNTTAVIVTVIDKATGARVIHDEASRTVNTVVLTFAVAPTTGQYTAIVEG